MTVRRSDFSLPVKLLLERSDIQIGRSYEVIAQNHCTFCLFNFVYKQIGHYTYYCIPCSGSRLSPLIVFFIFYFGGGGGGADPHFFLGPIYGRISAPRATI